MKKILNSYEEIRDALMNGREISLEISAEFEDAHKTVAEPTISCKHKIGELVERDGHRGIYIGEADNGPVIVDLHDASKTMAWDEAKEYAQKEGKRLPSQRELMLMFVHQEKLNAALEEHEGKAWEKGWYWSSSEYSNSRAWFVGANNGVVDWGDKSDYAGYVRCVLA